MFNGSYRDGKIEAFKMMDRYLYVIAESCDLVTSRDFNVINEMRGFIENNLKNLGGERMTELKPCPFCGSWARLHSEETIYGPDRPGWYVQCGSSLCWAQTRSYGVKEQAIRTWNKRVKE